MAAAQLRWGQNEALVSKPWQREMGEPTPGHFLADLSGRTVFKARPLPIAEAEPVLRHPTLQLGGR